MRTLLERCSAQRKLAARCHHLNSVLAVSKWPGYGFLHLEPKPWPEPCMAPVLKFRCEKYRLNAFSGERSVRACVCFSCFWLAALGRCRPNRPCTGVSAFIDSRFLDPLDDRPMRLPSPSIHPPVKKGRSTIGAYQIDATQNARIAMGRYPLLMLSHGNTGTPLALHDLATALARKGFVVVAVLPEGTTMRTTAGWAR